MAHKHGVHDSDAHFTINPVTRLIRNDSSRKTVLIQGDHNSERFTFELPRYIEEHDMSQCTKVEVHFLNISVDRKRQNSGMYTVDDLQVHPDDNEKVICSWLISGNATQLAGVLSFRIRFKCEETNVITYAWSTAIYSDITISDGINADESFTLEYVDIIEQWKAAAMLEITDRVNVNVSEWAEMESGKVRGEMTAFSAQWNEALSVERARIDNLAKLPNGSTTGDAELIDVRVGADGKIYKSAGAAVRTQMQKLQTFVRSGTDSGMVEITNVYIADETQVGMEDCTTQGVTPSQAYGNGTVFTNDVRVTGIRLMSAITATTFGVFVFDGAGTLLTTITPVTPTITDNVFIFDDPIDVPAGGYVLLRFLDGVFYYIKTGTADLKEYQPGTGLLINSPIRIGIEYIYENVYQTTVFKDEPIFPTIQLKDYTLPRFTVNQKSEYAYFGRWFDYVVNGNAYKATNADGSSFAFHVQSATKLNIGLYPITTPEHTPYFAYSIDGEDFVRQKITDTTIPIPDTGEHWVWIIVDGMGENDPIAGGKWYGSVGVYFAGVSTDGVVRGADAVNKRILFIGDSIVEGINVLGSGATADTNSATYGFAFKTARLLNAIPLLCGYGGTAVLGNSSFHRPIEAIDYNLNGVLVNEQDPDIICIEHGYNDGTLVSSGKFTSGDFKAAYNALLDRITVKYPGVQIICMIPFKQSMKAEITECAKNRQHCHVVETEAWMVTYTDNAHPNVIGANVAAEQLAKSITSIFGKQYFM